MAERLFNFETGNFSRLVVDMTNNTFNEDCEHACMHAY